uniref:PDZ domain-containing protein n=1 Tax=Alexandrium monilatum TaxID=311494 RepID=A0A7S4V3D0_9DINO
MGATAACTCSGKNTPDAVALGCGGPGTGTRCRHLGGDEGDVYYVTLDKADGEKLGLEVNCAAAGDAMPVRRVTGGLAERWNDVNPESRIEAGDSIFEVNGVRGTSATLSERCRDDQILRLKIRRTALA